MRSHWIGFVFAGALGAQSVGGPVLGYVVDAAARMRPLYGMPAAAHVGSAIQEGVRDSWGGLALLTDGSGMINGRKLEGAWTTVQPGALVSADERSMLVVGDGAAPWRLAVPERILTARVSASGGHVLTLLADESLALWSRGGSAEWRMQASAWWSIGFAGDRAMAYDPAAHALLWLDNGATTILRKLDGEGGRYSLAVSRASSYAVLLGDRLLMVPIAGGEVRRAGVPDGSERLEAVQSGDAFLLTRNPARPLWLLAPEREEPLLVIPALAVEKGGQQ